MQPLWSPSGDLIFISDRSGFWNLYSEHSGNVKALLPMQAEFSSPAWVFGIRSYQILPDGRLERTKLDLRDLCPCSQTYTLPLDGRCHTCS